MRLSVNANFRFSLLQKMTHRQDIFMRGWFATDHEKRWEKFACSVDCISSNWGLSLDWKQVQNSMMQYDSHANFLKNKYDSSELMTHSVHSWPRKIHFWVAKLSIWHQFYFGILVLNHKLKLIVEQLLIWADRHCKRQTERFDTLS